MILCVFQHARLLRRHNKRMPVIAVLNELALLRFFGGFPGNTNEGRELAFSPDAIPRLCCLKTLLCDGDLLGSKGWPRRLKMPLILGLLRPQDARSRERHDTDTNFQIHRVRVPVIR